MILSSFLLLSGQSLQDIIGQPIGIEFVPVLELLYPLVDLVLAVSEFLAEPVRWQA
jgi:hypothetical protein